MRHVLGDHRGEVKEDGGTPHGERAIERGPPGQQMFETKVNEVLNTNKWMMNAYEYSPSIPLYLHLCMLLSPPRSL